MGVGRKKLKPGVFPTVFEFKKKEIKKKRKCPKIVSLSRKSLLVNLKAAQRKTMNVSILTIFCHMNLGTRSPSRRKCKYPSLRKLCVLIHEENEELKSKHIYSYKKIRDNEKHFKSATGLEKLKNKLKITALLLYVVEHFISGLL